MIDVYARETADGWLLEIADEGRDILSGPFETEKLMLAAAKDLDLNILSTQVLTANITVRNKVLTVRDRKAGDLFRIDDYWYRLREHKGKKAVVDVVGEDKIAELASNDKITQVSVTSLQ